MSDDMKPKAFDADGNELDIENEPVAAQVMARAGEMLCQLLDILPEVTRTPRGGLLVLMMMPQMMRTAMENFEGSGFPITDEEYARMASNAADLTSMVQAVRIEPNIGAVN